MSLVGCLWVGLGGGLGAISRYLLGEWVGKHSGFPTGTLTVNLLGCLLIGILASQKNELRLLLVVGFLGGFTTYSSFGLDAVMLLKERPGQAVLYVGLHVLLGLAAVWLGLKLSAQAG